MADVNSNTLVAGQGVFRVENVINNQTLASGQTGDLVTIGTAGKITRLTYIATASSVAQAGISFERDGVVITPSGSLADVSPTPGDFFISRTSFAMGLGSINQISGEFIKIIKDAGNTTEDIKYEYETGEIK